MRQVWINRLRERVANVLAEPVTYRALVSSTAADTAELRRISLAVHSGVNEIELMLNPNETDHVQFVAMLREWCSGFGDVKNWDDDKTNKQNKLHFEILSACGDILKREWMVVKSGE